MGIRADKEGDLVLGAQQAMEQDYWKLREIETRYRLLFDASNEPVLLIGAEDLRVVEANPDLLVRSGPRLVDGLEELARLLHPELFK